MKDGVVQQVDKPTDVFSYPNNAFVAGFIGTPQMNFFEATVSADSENAVMEFVNGEKMTVPAKEMRKMKDGYRDGQPHKLLVGVRAEHIELAETGITTKLSISEVLGSNTNLFVHFDGHDKDYIVSVENKGTIMESGTTLHLRFKHDKIHLFDAETSESILERNF